MTEIRVTCILASWRSILVVVSVVKILLMIGGPVYGDLFNWTRGAEIILESRQVAGLLPVFLQTGLAYMPIAFILTPFFWLWTVLPVDHPTIAVLRNSNHLTPGAMSLILLMKLSPFLADVGVGFLLLKLVSRVTGSSQKGKVALLLWYVNPYNVFWIEVFGSMDVIPTLVLVLAVFLGMSRKWFKSGFSLATATILRIFPLFTFPFLILAVKGKTRHAYIPLVSGFLLPLIGALTIIYTTGAGTISSILDNLLYEPWLLDFLGFKLTNQYVRLVPVLLAVQFYVIFCCWKNRGILQLTIVSLLSILGGYVYRGINNHFLWVVPFLTVSVTMNHDELSLFVVTLIAASLYPFIFPFPALPLWSDLIHFFDPFYAGFFYAATAAYLLRINFKNIRLNH